MPLTFSSVFNESFFSVQTICIDKRCFERQGGGIMKKRGIVMHLMNEEIRNFGTGPDTSTRAGVNTDLAIWHYQ